VIDFSQSPNKRLNTKKSVLDPVIITIDEEEKEKEEETASGTSGGSGIDPHELKRLRREVKKKINSRNITNCRYLYDYLYETVEQKHENVEQKHETASRRSSTTKIENNGSDRKSNQSPNYTRGDTILLSDGESPSKGLKAVKRESGMSEEAEGGEFWNKKQKFVCQAPTQTSNLNEHLTEPLEKLFNAYVAQGDKGHAHGYRKTIAFIKVYPKKVENLSDLDDMKQLGAKMREKVKEILRTGQLRQANMLTNNAQVATLETFTKIWGVGPEKANRLYAQGMRTLEDLQKNQHLLSDIQKVGLKYVEDFDIKMTRQEVESIVAIIKAKIDELHGPDTYNICITGSYRRGREMCGDVDIVMAPKDDRPSEHFPTALVHALEGSLFIDHFSMPQPKFGCQSYIGVALLPSGTPRKVDIKHYPREMFGLGVLYFTGSGNYYRSMRELAQSLGYTLSDEGLAPIDRTEHNKGYPLGKVMPCYTEEDIFKYFGLQWKDPTERDLG
jgi:DNA polymerase lambda